jgi:hypothetical protein
VFDLETDETIWETENGSITMGTDIESSMKTSNLLHGEMDEVRWYTRGLTDKEIGCIASGKSNCPQGVYYAKPYNSDSCNRKSEDIEDAAECEAAIKQLLLDNILGNSLNGGKRFGKVIVDKHINAPYDTPTRCSYREEDAQMVWNPNPTGRGHTSLAPICLRTPRNEPDRSEVGCLPKCLENGQWSQAFPTCEKDWCNPIFEEWHCCKNRREQKYLADKDSKNYDVPFLAMDYYKKYHGLRDTLCPIHYGDCDKDVDCHDGPNGEGFCSATRDLNNIDICIEDIDPCDEKFATGTLCTVLSAVGVDYRTAAAHGQTAGMFLGGSIIVLGALFGYRYMKGGNKDEYSYLLQEDDI